MSWYAPNRVLTPTEFAGMVMNPNSSVKSVAAIPMQAITPRISCNGLIGRCSATAGLGIKALLLTQSCHASASLNPLGIAHVQPCVFGLSEKVHDAHRRQVVASTAAQSFLTRRLRTRKLRHEYQKNDLVRGRPLCA